MAFFASTILSVVILRWVPVYFTPLMFIRMAQQKVNHQELTLHHHWVPLDEIAPSLPLAVMASEDAHFLEHHGFDFKAIEQAAMRNIKHPDKRKHGASTISQQTAKNVFTLHGRTVWRKGVEAWFTFLIERIWGKERIMEVYLNVAEMGKGVYGAQAAAQAFFGKDASALTRREAATIAACLPAPLTRDAAHPSKYVSSRASTISRMIPNLKYPDWIERKD